MRFPTLISRKELELDWRPMHKLYKNATHNPKANRMLIIYPYRFTSSIKGSFFKFNESDLELHKIFWPEASLRALNFALLGEIYAEAKRGD